MTFEELVGMLEKTRIQHTKDLEAFLQRLKAGIGAARLCHEKLELCWNAMNDEKNGDQQMMEVANKPIRFARFEGKGSNNLILKEE